MFHAPTLDAVVIGAGFFGCEVALELRRLGLSRVVVLEREAGLMRRASYVNQARVHNGYHYPRAITTARRSRENFERFLAEYRYAVGESLTKLYAVARTSRVNAVQFDAFCRRIGAPCREGTVAQRRLFDEALIDTVFLTRELTFDAAAIAGAMARQLDAAGVEVRFGCPARIAGDSGAEGALAVEVPGGRLRARWVFNCTYANLEFVGAPLRTGIKKELAELVLITPPSALQGIGVTVMDGPFFSTLPFPARQAYSLSHVRHTPHRAAAPGEPLPGAPTRSNAAAILRDSARYLPCLSEAETLGSLFEIKAILVRNEGDDGRPILVERGLEQPRIVSVLGGKIDNVYDVRMALRDIMMGADP